MRNRKVKTIAATVTIFGALLFLRFNLEPGLPSVDRRTHEALGRVLAEEAAKRLGAGGKIALIIRDTSVYPNPAADVQVMSFHRALRNAGLAVATTNLIKFDPLRVVRVPAGDFFEILRKQSEANVVVSFLGPPVLTDEQLAKLGQKLPHVVAVCTGGIPRQTGLADLFARKLVDAAIVSRPNPGPQPPSSGDAEAWFTYLFEVVTPANLSELSDSPASREGGAK